MNPTEYLEIEVAPGRRRRVPADQYIVPIAPLCGFTGQIGRKPWEYGVSVCMAHLNTVPQLQLALDLWRCQTVRPYFMVIDTGSPAELLPELEKLRRPDCEFHYVRAHGYLHSSAPVSAALDLAHTLCRTEYLFHTHTDVFPRRRDFFAWMIGQCNAQTPVVGWQMSPREMAASPYKAEWRESVSHTATMIHMPTAHKAGLTWAMEGYYAWRPEERIPSMGWPDTESPFHLAMKRAGIKPVLLGGEPNFELHRTEWWDHARSFTGLKAGARDGDLKSNFFYAKAIAYMATAEAEARQRLAQWRAG